MPQKKRYVQLGLTVFCTVAAILLFYDTLFGHRALQKFCGQFLEAIAPILYGSFMAYLLAPMVSFFERLSPQAQAAAGRADPPGGEHPADLDGHWLPAVPAGLGADPGAL